MTQRNKKQEQHKHHAARTVAATVLSLALFATIGGGAWVWSGFYNVSALEQHTAPVYYTLDYALHRSIMHGAASIERPALDLEDTQLIRSGKRHYQEYCVQCHGAPGVARDPIGRSMTPVPSNLVDSAMHLSSEQIFWTIKNGVKMTGMPGWAFVFSEHELWAVTAFVMHMPALSPRDYETLSATTPATPMQSAPDEKTSKAERGRLALQAYACTSCHTVEGIVSREVNTGPPLQGIAGRRYIAGVLPNTFDNLVRWIREPQLIDPLTAMPDLDVSEADAAAMATYLYGEGGRSNTSDQPGAGLAHERESNVQ